MEAARIAAAIPMRTSTVSNSGMVGRDPRIGRDTRFDPRVVAVRDARSDKLFATAHRASIEHAPGIPPGELRVAAIYEMWRDCPRRLAHVAQMERVDVPVYTDPAALRAAQRKRRHLTRCRIPFPAQDAASMIQRAVRRCGWRRLFLRYLFGAGSAYGIRLSSFRLLAASADQAAWARTV